jgi:hypothetical protein
LRATREKFRQLRGKATLARQSRLIRERLSTLERAMKIDPLVIARFKEVSIHSSSSSCTLSDQQRVDV